MASSETDSPQGAPPGAAVPAPAASPQDVSALERALLEGLGVPDLHLPQGLTPELMETLGGVLRESVRGTMELLRVRSQTKSSVHADVTMIGAADVNPLKAAWDAEIALEHLLAPRREDTERRRPRAVLEAYQDLRLHDRGLAAGIHAAVAGLLARLAPETIERNAETPSALDQIMLGNKKARQWDLLLERYEDLSVQAKKDLWAPFEREFRRAYVAGQRGQEGSSAPATPSSARDVSEP